ncbi:hypothetical protein [Stenotrophomonas sp.]|uniref:hypothetical protein n=1 Tax=Stenotrophomonas sp. TaxID=69392 RepID=UPI002FC91688
MEPRTAGAAPPPVPAHAPTPPGARPAPDDLAQLRLLSVFHYVMAALFALGALFPLIYLVLGIAVLCGAMPVDSSTASSPAEIQLLGTVFTVLGGLGVLAMIAMAGLIGHAAGCLARQQRHTLCLIAAGLCCMSVPLGTVLGVFTLIVLSRTSVRERFLAGAAAPPSPP